MNAFFWIFATGVAATTCVVTDSSANSNTCVSEFGGSCLLQHKAQRGTRKELADGEVDVESSAAKHFRTVKCPDGHADEISVDSLNTALKLGAKWIMKSQRPEGNFHYEYDWRSRKDSDDDNSVRQAGTTWGLAFLHADDPSPELAAAVQKALGFFEKRSVLLPDGRRILRYPGEPYGKLGTVALVVLAHVDFLRSQPNISEDTQRELRTHLDQYIATLLHAEHFQKVGDQKFHIFHGGYRPANGEYIKKSSPYFDGESLLALIRTARRLNRTELWDRIPRLANGGWNINAEHGLEKNEDSKRMKGFYQWSSMAMYELLQAGDRFQKYAPRILRYANWILGTHNVKSRKHNVGYVFEGLIPAYLVALKTKQSDQADKMACLIRSGVMNLNSMQIGHPDAKGIASEAPHSDQRALGGVQAARDAPQLRIDTAQHQLHAILQAKQLLTGKDPDYLLF